MASSSSFRANSVKVDASTFGDLESALVHRRRALKAEINGGISPHMFRATGISVYLENGGTLEHAQQIAAHESARATKLYGELAADPKSRA
jgi:integrase